MDMRGQHGNRDGQMDEYGNPIQQTDVYEKSLPTREAGYGTTGAGYGTTTEAGGEQPQMTHSEKEHHGGGMLHRSGSSGSSSSEDDGMGGRRKKKGMKEKIKEKLPGGRKTDEHGQQGHGHGPATIGTGHEGIITTTGATGHHDPEKKGFVEKIKEKMPDGDKIVEHEQQGGGDGHGQATMGTSTGYGGTTMTTGATGHHDLEKKGLMEKIKKKLPGGDKTDEHGQQGHGHGQATTGTGHRESTTTTGAARHHDPEKKGFMENIKEKLPGGDKTVEHEKQGYEHGQATMATGTGYGETTTTTGAIGHHDPEKKDFVQKIKEKLPGEDKTDEHGQQRYGHGHATTGTGTGYGETTTTTGAIGHHDPEKKGFMEIKEKLPGGDKTDEHGQQGYGHGQATMGTGHKESATTTGAVGHHDPEKNGFMEKIKEKQPGGDKTVEHEQQGYGHEKATTGTGPGYGETTTTTGAIGHHDPEKKGFVKKIKEKLSGEDKTDEHGQQGYGHEQATTGTGNKETTTMTGTTMTGAAGHHDPEKKGFMKKIMEKLPGHN